MSRKSDYEKLVQVTNAAMDAAQGQMNKLIAEEQAIKNQIDALQAARLSDSPGGTAAQQGAAHVKWQIWIQHRQQELNHELARIYVKKDMARKKLKRSFGKDQAVQALLKKQRLVQIMNSRRQTS